MKNPVVAGNADIALTIPVLKMPPDLALPALRILATASGADARQAALTALRPNIPVRTLLNAYVLPSLTELKLYSGTLRGGNVTRYGEAIARARETQAHSLLARHLAELDSSRVGLIDWLSEFGSSGQRKRAALKQFAQDRLGVDSGASSVTLDRLGKWVGYLLHFGVVRENNDGRGARWSVSRRHVAALKASNDKSSSPPVLPPDVLRDALLGAYSTTSHQLGTRLYLPILAVRDELGRELNRAGTLLSDVRLDEILRRAPSLLPEYIVSFSPFSGPARGGLQLDGLYAGFISVRPRPMTRSGTENG